MKIAGIILLVLGSLSTLGAIVAIAQGHDSPSFAGLTFVVLGLFLISRANKKEKEEEEKRRWEENSSEQQESK